MTTYGTAGSLALSKLQRLEGFFHIQLENKLDQSTRGQERILHAPSLLRKVTRQRETVAGMTELEKVVIADGHNPAIALNGHS